jgi:hypothetical protein
MEDIQVRINGNFLLGCIKYKEKFKLYLMPVASWILNYRKYDPSYNPMEWKEPFRGNILNVSDDRLDDFFEIIMTDHVTPGELLNAPRANDPQIFRLAFFVDFDKKLFINGANDNVEPEEYLPDENWVGLIGNPDDYLPKYLQEELSGS